MLHRRWKRMTFTFLHLILLSFLNLSSHAIVMWHIYKSVTFWLADHFLLRAENFGNAFQKHFNHFTHQKLFLDLYIFGKSCRLQTDAVSQLEDTSHIPLLLNNDGQAQWVTFATLCLATLIQPGKGCPDLAYSHLCHRSAGWCQTLWETPDSHNPAAGLPGNAGWLPAACSLCCPPAGQQTTLSGFALYFQDAQGTKYCN